jgi:hypothetical protein
LERAVLYVRKKGKELLFRLDSVDLLDSKVFNAILESLNLCNIASCYFNAFSRDLRH